MGKNKGTLANSVPLVGLGLIFSNLKLPISSLCSETSSGPKTRVHQCRRNETSRFKLNSTSFLFPNHGFLVLWSTLARIPKTRLGMLRDTTCMWDLKQLVDDYCPETGEIFYDRHPGYFNTILNFYR